LNQKRVCCWDLEGPISIIDFAAEIGKMLNQKPQLNLQNYNMGDFFYMISNYDDYLIDVPGVKENLGIPEYQPGDTLRLMAPLYVSCFTDKELTSLARKNLGLLPGCRELISILHKEWDIFVISTSYTHFAYTVTSALNIPQDHVYCTDLKIEKMKEGISDFSKEVELLVKGIFQKYLDNFKDLNSVITDLNDFFWQTNESDYNKVMNQVKVRGGKRKELAVEDISKRTNTEISQMIALGDSITDINMLQRLKEENGIAISFNGNRFTVERANVAVTSPNNLGVLPIFESILKIDTFLEKWEKASKMFNENPKNIPNGLISENTKNSFIKYDFVPDIDNLLNKTNKEITEIISKQEKMRKYVRGWAGNLG